MNKIIAIGAAVLVLAVGGVAMAIASPNISSPETIKLVAHTTSDTFVDADGSGSFSVGDYNVFTDDLFNREETAQVGTDAARCMIIRPEEIFCDGALTLDGRGQISVAGNIRFPEGAAATGKFGLGGESANPRAVDIAVTGGTGEFSNARGFMRILPGPGRDTERYTLHLIP